MMLLIINLVLAIGDLFRSQKSLQVEVIRLRHENVIPRRRAPKRLHLTNLDRLLLVWVHWLWPEQARRWPDLANFTGQPDGWYCRH